jgi:hypothetical protein
VGNYYEDLRRRSEDTFRAAKRRNYPEVVEGTVDVGEEFGKGALGLAALGAATGACGGAGILLGA